MTCTGRANMRYTTRKVTFSAKNLAIAKAREKAAKRKKPTPKPKTIKTFNKKAFTQVFKKS